MVDVLVQGKCTWDDWILAGEVPAESQFGGSGANIAVDLATLGIDTGLVTCLASDQYGQLYSNRLQSAGIATHQIGEGILQTPICSIVLGEKYWWRQGGPEPPNPSSVKLETLLMESRIYVLTDDAPAVRIPEGVGAVWVPQNWLADRCDAEIQHFATADFWDAIFLNNRERTLVELATKKSIYELSQHNHDIRYVCTNGNLPTELYHNGTVTIVPIVEPKTLKNPLGGGDAVVAGYVAGTVQGLSPIRSLKLGLLLAARIVSQIGCQPLLEHCTNGVGSDLLT